MEKHNYRKMLERELREKMEYEDKLGKATVVQKQQLMDAKLKRLKFIEEDILEGSCYFGSSSSSLSALCPTSSLVSSTKNEAIRGLPK